MSLLKHDLFAGLKFFIVGKLFVSIPGDGSRQALRAQRHEGAAENQTGKLQNGCRGHRHEGIEGREGVLTTLDLRSHPKGASHEGRGGH